jgi:hypothetical protein
VVYSFLSNVRVVKDFLLMCLEAEVSVRFDAVETRVWRYGVAPPIAGVYYCTQYLQRNLSFSI